MASTCCAPTPLQAVLRYRDRWLQALRLAQHRPRRRQYRDRRNLPPPASQEARPEQDTANRQSGWNAEANLRSWRSMQ